RPRTPTAAREALERRWRERIVATPALAELVTGASLADEPYHRWLRYKQAYAPKLVRVFLARAVGLEADEAPLLDPFAGAGTLPIECARRGLAAIGVEALDALVFLANARHATACPDPPRLDGCVTWEQFAARLHEPIHQAALICARARQYDRDGRPLAHPRPLAELFRRVWAEIVADCRRPLAARVDVRQGDARVLADVPDASVGGVLTSPPYLSRHDYTRVTRPHEQTHAFWYEATPIGKRRAAQVPAHPAASPRQRTQEMPPAVAEICEAYAIEGAFRLADVVRSYFDDMFQSLRSAARVLRAGRPLWLVVGGARLRGVYIPADLILAEYAAEAGFEVLGVRHARDLIRGGRRLGAIERVTPREVVIVMRRRR
ncbi:MAG: hypothetical protein D6744_01925, partial [Planctomycetota bacterium]